jgi:protein SCO1/2
MSRSLFTCLVLCLLAPLAFFVVGCRQAQALPEFGKVPAFALTDQDGRPFSNSTLAGKVWVAAFVFTRCPMACPKVTKAMKGVLVDAEREAVQLHFVSFSIDPENDTPEVLRKYAHDYGVDTARWTFVTGDPTAIRITAERGFKIAVEGVADPSKADFGITHGTQLVLVDKEGSIRGFYGSGDAEALRKMVSDAGRLASK